MRQLVPASVIAVDRQKAATPFALREGELVSYIIVMGEFGSASPEAEP